MVGWRSGRREGGSGWLVVRLLGILLVWEGGSVGLANRVRWDGCLVLQTQRVETGLSRT